MSEYLQQVDTQQSTDFQIWRFRWFFVYLYAIALILSIIASVIIALISKSGYPGIIPAPLLLAMKPMVRWAFSSHVDI